MRQGLLIRNIELVEVWSKRQGERSMEREVWIKKLAAKESIRDDVNSKGT